MPTISFLTIQRSDFPLLSQWLMTAHVTRWWNDGPSLAAIEADYGGVVDGTEPAAAFIAYRDAVPIGLIQRYRVDAYRNMKRSWNTSCLFPTRLAASTT